MGGLKDKLPVVYKTFIIGAAALAALPLISAGFYSKDAILWYSISSQNGSILLWLAAIVGSFITALYSTRMVVLTFFGESKTEVSYLPKWKMIIPLIILAFLSIVGGFIELPHNFGHVTLFSDLLSNMLPSVQLSEGFSELTFQLLAAVICLLGIFLGWKLYTNNQLLHNKLKDSTFFESIHNFLLSGWKFDVLYNALFQQPYRLLAKANKNDIVDQLNTIIVDFCNWLYQMLSFTQSGSLRWYVMGIIAGTIMILTLQLLL